MSMRKCRCRALLYFSRHDCPFHSHSQTHVSCSFSFSNCTYFVFFFFSYRFRCNGGSSKSSSPSSFSARSNHIYQMDSPIDDLEGGRRRSSPATWCTICYAWASFLFWTVTILLLIFGISLFALLRSNLPDVQIHRLDVYKLSVTEPQNKNKDTQLAIDVQVLVNVTNNNKKMTLVYGGMNAETMIEGFSLPKVHVDGFRQKAKTTRDLRIHPQQMRSAVNDDDARELKLSASQHEMVVTLKMKGKIEFWYNGRMVSKLGLNVLCDGIEQSQIDQALAPECNVKLSLFS